MTITLPKQLAPYVAVIAALTFLTEPLPADNLNPTAPPAETMKTLEQVEPRTPLGQADFPKTITQTGSYYLTQDVTVAGANDNGITIDPNNVTIDLMGFTITGPGSGAGSGIFMNGRTNIEIKNGTVQRFGKAGVFEASFSGSGHRVIGVRSIENGQYGIWLWSDNNLVKDCAATDNGANSSVDVYGIRSDLNSTLMNNTVTNNGKGSQSNASIYGIFVKSDSKVIGNISNDNGSNATGTVYGVFASDDSIVSDNVVSDNGRASTGTLVYGIYTSARAMIKNNMVSGIGGQATLAAVYGIYADGGGTIVGNTVKDCGNGTAILPGAITVCGIWNNAIFDTLVTGGITEGNTVDNNGTKATGTVYGINSGLAAQVTDNSISNNGTNATGIVFGIKSRGASQVTDNSVSDNGKDAGSNAVTGIEVLSGSKVIGNMVYNNGDGAGGFVTSILAFTSGCLISNNTCFSNGYQAGNVVQGISTGDGNIIVNNSVHNNGREASTAWGIRADIGCNITGNTVYENGISAVSDTRGILTGDTCVIETNVSLEHTLNLTNGTGCLLVNNIAP